METLFTFINLTFRANINVDLVSKEEMKLGLIFAIRWVLEFPPKESFNRNVNLESL